MKETADRFVACDRRRENEEAEEREQEHIVHAEEQLSVDYQYDRDHDHDRDIPKLSAAHDRREDHDKEHKVAHTALPSRSFPRFGDLLRVDLDPPAVLFSVHNAYEYNEQNRRPDAERRHVEHEVQRARAGLLVKEKVLRAAERHQKRAADRGDILKCDDGQDALLAPRAPEEQDRERNEDYERNVIRYKHGRKEHSEDKKERKRSHPSKAGAEPDDRVKKALLLKALKNGQHHKERSESMPVDLREELCCGRRDKKRDDRCCHRNYKHGFFFEEFLKSCHIFRLFKFVYLCELFRICLSLRSISVR